MFDINGVEVVLQQPLELIEGGLFFTFQPIRLEVIEFNS